jgi:hypothetical protein
MVLPNWRSRERGDQRTFSRTLLAIISKQSVRRQSPNSSPTFGYRHELGLFTINLAKPLGIGHLGGFNLTVNLRPRGSLLYSARILLFAIQRYAGRLECS